ncbi:hypothetical protein [Halomonas sp. 707B3]|uniref:hypothetical protein n=1 Tax=Halomonas sp. 707B3 TaxID=1681043 RepID=UPI0020A1B7B6|nr:hypothetical protein [Halomonas sp. 707B3]MCP1316869.1 hypothetical protein [Halomonas sp. 707B3]
MIYTVNTRTKEHKVMKNATDADAGKILMGMPSGDTWRVVKANHDGWLPWHGAEECPLPAMHTARILLRNGWQGTTDNPQFVRWTHMSDDSDIIAYRPIFEEDQKLPAVGSVCLYKPTGKTAHIVAHHMDGEQAIWCGSDGGGELFYGTAYDFRPLNSPREEWVDAALKIGGATSKAHAHRLGKLYDAMIDGKLPIPEAKQ